MVDTCSYIFQHKVLFLKQGFLVTPLKMMLVRSARKSFLRLCEKATVEGHKPDFRTCVINNTAAFSTRSSCRVYKPPGSECAGIFCRRSSERCSEYMKAGTCVNPFTAKTQQKKNKIKINHEGNIRGEKRLQCKHIHIITHLHMCDSVPLQQ